MLGRTSRRRNQRRPIIVDVNPVPLSELQLRILAELARGRASVRELVNILDEAEFMVNGELLALQRQRMVVLVHQVSPIRGWNRDDRWFVTGAGVLALQIRQAVRHAA